MKKALLLATLLIVTTMLTACGSKDDATVQKGASAQQASRREASPLGGGAQAEAAIVETPSLTSGAVAAPIGAQAELTSATSAEERPVDLDLTKLSGTVVYSQVYDMMTNPDSYMGQIIKMKGSFSYFQDPETKQEYFAAIIADATACCAQGIEFVWAGEHSYPRDYPPPDTDITVTGAFSTYDENGFMYVQLVDAQVEWDA
ncbi:MAG: hypothetical protein IJI71_05480 [Clostridia bacterium]|nr:hypothetical protein [Clostridia bacterium]